MPIFALEANRLFRSTLHIRRLDTSFFSHTCPGEVNTVFHTSHPTTKDQKHEDSDCEVIESSSKMYQYFLAFNPHIMLETWNVYTQISLSG